MRVNVGIDVAKDTHWVVAVNEQGEVLLDRALDNTPSAIEQLIADLGRLGGERVVGVDMLGGIATLVCAMLLVAGEKVVHVPGLVVNRARQGFSGGEKKSDRRDALVIADQVRVRRDLRPVTLESEDLAALRLLVARRRELVADQTRRLSRLHDLLVSIHPGLERVVDLTNKGSLWLLTRYVTPEEIRRGGLSRLTRHLKQAGGVRNVGELAEKALAAAREQSIAVPGERVAAELCREHAREALAARERIAALDRELGELLDRHPDGALVRSLPGMGAVLASEFLVETGDLRRFAGPDALAAAAGLAPVLRQSGRQRFLRRAFGGAKALKRVFYQSAFVSLRTPESRAFYDRKRREGKRHHQAVLCLARRRIDVLWAILRDRRPYQAPVPVEEAACA